MPAGLYAPNSQICRQSSDFLKQVEYGSPADLLRKDKGFFHSMVEESGDKDHLYELTEGKHGNIL